MFSRRLDAVATQVTAHLDAVLMDYPDQSVVDAMRYATSGGKRLRAFLVIESAALFDVPRTWALQAAAAVEVMHAYSLVHDDLPCMDDDDLRRGMPTVHVQWDQATAVLAGDALQALTFEVLADPATHPDAGVRVDLIGAMARAAGGRGMVLGQALDIAAESAGAPLTLTEITALQAGKTGALFRWSAEAGARLAGAPVAPLTAFATALGLAFQIADDILDVEGDSEKAGKRLHKDAGAGKATFVSLLGLDGARARARTLVQQAEHALEPYGAAAETLRQAARFAISREK